MHNFSGTLLARAMHFHFWTIKKNTWKSYLPGCAGVRQLGFSSSLSFPQENNFFHKLKRYNRIRRSTRQHELRFVRMPVDFRSTIGKICLKSSSEYLPPHRFWRNGINWCRSYHYKIFRAESDPTRILDVHQTYEALTCIELKG